MAESKENDKFDLGVKGLSDVDLSLRIRNYHFFLSSKKQNKTKNSWRLFRRAYGKGEDIVKIYPSLSVIRRVNEIVERNNVIF